MWNDTVVKPRSHIGAHGGRTAGVLKIGKSREPDFCQDLGEASELTPNA